MSTTALVGAMAMMPAHAEDADGRLLPREDGMRLRLAAAQQTAQSPSPRPFEIESQPLAAALRRFSEQSGVQVAYPSEEIGAIRSPGAAGTMTAEDALRRLLQGTGVTYRFTAATAVTLERAAGSGQDGATVLGPIVVEGTSEAPPPASDPVEGYKADYSSTLTRVPVPLRETPNAVGVITEDAIGDSAAMNLPQMAERVAGVGWGASGAAANLDYIRVRGFDVAGQNDFFGVAQNGLRGSAFHQVDPAMLERVEIIKGPTSIIGGAVSPGGFVNRVLKSPEQSDFIGGQVQGGSFDLRRLVADANRTFGSHGGAARLVAVGHWGGEFVDDTDRTRYAFLPSFKVDLGDATTVTAFANIQREEGREYMGFPLHDDGHIPDIPVTRFFGGQGGGYTRENESAHVDAVHRFVDGLKLNLKAAAGHSEYESRNIYAYSFGALPASGTTNILYHGRRDNDYVLSGEIALSYDFDLADRKQTVVAGVDAIRATRRGVFRYLTVGTDNIFNPSNSFTVPANFDYHVGAFQDFRGVLFQRAMFAQAVLRPLDSLTVMLGGRYDWANQKLDVLNNRANSTEGNEDAFTGRAGVSYEVLPDTNLYVSYSESFKPQPFNLAQSGGIIPPETAQQYEAGIKTEFFDGQLGATASVFRISRQNVATPAPGPGTGSVATGEQVHRGFEIEVNGQPVPGLRVSAAYANLLAEITESNTASDIGLTPGQVPHHQANLWASYELQSGDFKGLGFGAGAFFKDDVFASSGTARVPGYTRFDAALFYTGFKGVDIRVVARNLLDTRYIEQPGGSSFNYNRFGAPFSVIGTVKIGF